MSVRCFMSVIWYHSYSPLLIPTLSNNMPLFSKSIRRSFISKQREKFNFTLTLLNDVLCIIGSFISLIGDCAHRLSQHPPFSNKFVFRISPALCLNHGSPPSSLLLLDIHPLELLSDVLAHVSNDRPSLGRPFATILLRPSHKLFTR